MSHPNSLAAFLASFVRHQNSLQNRLGQVIAWGNLSLVLIAALVVILRYGFDTGSIALQQSVMYNHAFLFMLGIAYTYQLDKHVRVDVFYANYSDRRKAWVNLLGTLLFTLPAMAFIIWAGWDYVAISWQIQEGSAETGGIAYLYLLKSLIIIMAVLVISQAISVACQSGLKLFAPNYSITQESADNMEGKL
jgi:TRAP-type mannitol/chloroaromatic compound transport system permease small subunit